jgi:hypothetical protein
MDPIKSSRHSKITGDFGERLILYWLSKYGFECTFVDHTGIDLIARNPNTKELMGISVKSRSRNKGKENTDVSFPRENFEKANAACNAFGCIPYVAIVVDAADLIRGFLMPMSHFLKLCPVRKRSASWKMTKANLQKYYCDPNIKIFEMRTQTINWW